MVGQIFTGRTSIHGKTRTKHRKGKKGPASDLSNRTCITSKILYHILLLCGFRNHVSASYQMTFIQFLHIIHVSYIPNQLNKGQLDPCHSNFLKLDFMLKFMPLSGMILNMKPNFTELWWHESNFPQIPCILKILNQWPMGYRIK